MARRITRLLGAIQTSGSGGTTSFQGDVVIPATNRIYLDGSGGAGGNTYITETQADDFAIYAGGTRVLSGNASNMVINEDHGDVDIRIESDTNANSFVLDGGLFGGIGAFGFGNVPDATGTSYMRLAGSALTNAANEDFSWFHVNPAAVTINTGTSGVVASLRINEPNITLNGNTVTTAATLLIGTAPTEGSNNYAIFSDAGLNRFDGDGTNVFELPADATDPTSGGGAATGRIPVKVGGATVYLAYY